MVVSVSASCRTETFSMFKHDYSRETSTLATYGEEMSVHIAYTSIHGDVPEYEKNTTNLYYRKKYPPSIDYKSHNDVT